MTGSDGATAATRSTLARDRKGTTVTKLATAVAALFVVAALAGCEKKIDDEKLEGKINEFLAGKGVTASEVSCPSDVKEKKGDTFDCTAKVDEHTLTVTVEMQGDGAVSWNVTDFGGYQPAADPAAAEPATTPARPAADPPAPVGAQPGEDEAAVDDM